MEPSPVFVDLLAPYRDPGLAQMRLSALCGPLPSHRCTLLELSVSHDPMISGEHFLMRTILRDRISGERVASRTDICKALPLSGHVDDRQIYVREMCQMIAPHVRAHHLKLRHLARVVDVMNESWNLLGVFQELEELDAVFRRRRALADELTKGAQGEDSPQAADVLPNRDRRDAPGSTDLNGDGTTFSVVLMAHPR
jgi:hypothetical protein